MRFGAQRDVEAEHVRRGEKRFAALRHGEPGRARPRRRPRAAPARDAHPERSPDLGDEAADTAEGVNAERLARDAPPERAEPQASLQPLRLLRNLAQGGEDQPQASSAVALGELAPPAETTMPRSVQAA